MKCYHFPDGPAWKAMRPSPPGLGVLETRLSPRSLRKIWLVENGKVTKLRPGMWSALRTVATEVTTVWQTPQAKNTVLGARKGLAVP